MNFDLPPHDGGLTRQVRIDDADSLLPPPRIQTSHSYPLTPYPTSNNLRGGGGASDPPDILSDLVNRLGAGGEETSPLGSTQSTINSDEQTMSEDAADDGTTAAAQAEPDWSKIAQEEPSKTTVPLFLAARQRGDEADEPFASQVDQCQGVATGTIKEVRDVALQAMPL